MSAFKVPTECEFLNDSRLCKAVAENPGLREEFCEKHPKNICCYLCSRHDNCEIACSYLQEPEESEEKSALSSEDTKAAIDGEIRKHREEIENLSVLLAQQRIGEQSYLAATSALEGKIRRLESDHANPTLSTVRDGKPEENSEFKQRTAPIKHPSGIWYLVPFFFGLLGAIVAYVAVRNDDKEMGDSLLIFGTIWNVILFLLGWAWITSLLHL